MSAEGIANKQQQHSGQMLQVCCEMLQPLLKAHKCCCTCSVYLLKHVLGLTDLLGQVIWHPWYCLKSAPIWDVQVHFHEKLVATQLLRLSIRRAAVSLKTPQKAYRAECNHLQCCTIHVAAKVAYSWPNGGDACSTMYASESYCANVGPTTSLTVCKILVPKFLGPVTFAPWRCFGS